MLSRRKFSMNVRNVTAKVAIIALFLFSLVTIGCDIAANATYDALVSKGKPSPVTIDTVVLPEIYEGVQGEVIALVPEFQMKTYWPEEAFLPVGGAIPLMYDNDEGTFRALSSDEAPAYRQIGEILYGYYSNACSLWAGQDNYAGNATISNDQDGITITIDTTDAADIAEYHIYAYTRKGYLPTKRPAPGQAPYILENENADSVSITLSYAQLGGTVDDTYYFIIHTALTTDSTEGSTSALAGETAYVAGEEAPSFEGKGAWFCVVSYAAFESWVPIVEKIDAPPPPPPVGIDTTGWDEETAWAGDSEGPGSAWWFYIDASASNSIMQNIYAGKKQVVGAYVNYNKIEGTLTIALGGNMVFSQHDKEGKVVTEPVKIQGYTILPDDRPAAGHFTVKLGNEANLTNIAVGSYSYLLVHLDVLVNPHGVVDTEDDTGDGDDASPW